MPSTGSDRPPAWEVHLSTEARDWLTNCTNDQAALARVMSSFSFIFQKLEIAGPRVGEPDIKKLIATQGMWEARVKDPTGEYRMFFRFGWIGHRRIAAIAHGRKKGGQRLPRSVIDLAQHKVDAFLAELGANGFTDQD
jgi:hypothetical protein